MCFGILASKHTSLIFVFHCNVSGTDFVNGLNSASTLQASKWIACIALFLSKLYFTTEWKHQILCMIKSMRSVSGF